MASTGPFSSTGSPITLRMRPSVASPTGTWIGLAGVGDLVAADEAFGGVHGDGADGGLAEVLGDLEDEALAVVVGLERVQDLGQVVLELHVDDGADDLGDLADCCFGGHGVVSVRQSASAPEMISMSSLVIAAWRERL